MRELQLRATCDVDCDEQFIVHPGDDPVVIEVAGQKVELDLCDKHGEEFRRLWFSAGRPVLAGKTAKVVKEAPTPVKTRRRSRRTKRQTGPFICEQHGMSYAHSSTLRSHLRNVHGLPHDEIANIMFDKFGGRTPMPRENCPECGESFSLTMMSRHRKVAHGVGDE